MNYIFPFEKLQVWQVSKSFAVQIYLCTSGFPDSEKYGLCNQMRRSSISISSNIAEGNSRYGKNDRIKFFNIAHSSLMELLSQAMIANELQIINNQDISNIRELGIEISNKLMALINSQKEYNP
jgi:four helix bundle protein